MGNGDREIDREYRMLEVNRAHINTILPGQGETIAWVGPWNCFDINKMIDMNYL